MTRSIHPDGDIGEGTSGGEGADEIVSSSYS